MEFVFVVPRTALFPECAPHGLAVFGESWSRSTFDDVVRSEGFFVERDYAERTPTLQQIIPYTLVLRGEDLLLLQRTKGGGETRLHNKLSIGVGGHVNPVDAIHPGSDEDGAKGAASRICDPLPAATRREVLEEELIVTGQTRLTPIGLLNDDTNAVGAVHVGLVQVLEVLEGDAQIREVDQLCGDFVTKSQLRQKLEEGANFETWSSLLVPELNRILESLAGHTHTASFSGSGSSPQPAVLTPAGAPSAPLS
jgi:predicted NUDIX family phosphoesterase